MRPIIIFALLVLFMCAAALACKSSFGADEPAVLKVQSSWYPAEQAMDRGHYAEALKMVRSTERFLSTISDKRVRKCVAEGAQMRIVEAIAGAAYLKKHNRNFSGARLASQKAWRALVFTDVCP